MSADWLSALPPGWEVRRPKTIFRERREASRSDDVHLTPSQHHGVLPQAEYMRLTGSKVVLNFTGADNMKHVEEDDFVIHLRSFQGGIEHSRHSGKVSNAYTVLAPRASIEPRYYRWVLKSAGYIQQLASSTDQLRDGQSIKYDQFARIPLPLPPLDVQRRIADFLDDQVRRLSEASHRRVHQLALTAEERQATLENLVLGRGLGESCPAQWSPFGQVPKRWAETRLRSVPCTVATGPFGSQLHAEEYVSGGYPVVNPANISPQGLIAFENVTVDMETRERLSRHMLKEDDIVFARRGELGRAALVTRDEVGWVCGTGALVVRLSDRMLRPAYLVRLLQTAALKFYFDTQAVGSTMANLNTSILLAMPLLLPPVEDQSEVLEQCDRVEDKFRHGEAALKRSQELLEERKRSLITAAVTGEFDVSSASSRAADVALSGVGGVG